MIREAQADLEGQAFDRVSRIMYEISGVNLTAGKRELVRARIAKRMRILGHDNVDQYVDHVESEESGEELGHMVDILTTNKTSFFRELPHFDYLRTVALPQWMERGGPLRIWSAGCSSGEEPYSVAMLIHEVVKDVSRRDVRILATDLSTTVLASAREGRYGAQQVEEIPPRMRERYFVAARTQGRGPRTYEVAATIRNMVTFGPLNLMGPWPMNGPFDFIMCRNVMIYFDRPTRETLVRRFRELLRPRGHLLVGHSESLNGMRHELEYVQPAVYLR